MMTAFQGSRVPESELPATYEALLSLAGKLPKAAFKCLYAKPFPVRPNRTLRYCLRMQFIRGLDRFAEGQVFAIAGRPEKTIRFITTFVPHGPIDPSELLIWGNAEPINCDCEDLTNVFLIASEEE